MCISVRKASICMQNDQLQKIPENTVRQLATEMKYTVITTQFPAPGKNKATDNTEYSSIHCQQMKVIDSVVFYS